LSVNVVQTPTFKKQFKKLDKPIKKFVEEAIRAIIDVPSLGDEKKGDLEGVFVYKFKAKSQLYLLAYKYDIETRELRAIGVRENFYRDLKRKN
jgi:mRNA-degrading endonuclease RelE of RelBE toxin-antitoxin system